ncbi:MAG TPA: hypothetical protein VKU77_26645 [Streptosporangiaceae bacterium]|nr:hypothetical protein [Streptosporangiaceae bacterium]
MSYLGIRSSLERIRFNGHVWRTKAGKVCATVDLGDTTVWFESADDARAVAAVCTEAAEAMDQFTAGGEEH